MDVLKTMNIILIRHGQTKWNLEMRYQGILDSNLTTKGKQQARDNAKKLLKKFNNFDNIKIFASPLGRAKSSAYIICDELNISKNKIIFDERLKEFNYGIFEGKTRDECRKIYPKELQDREANKWSYEIENGDSYIEVSKRLKSWLNDIKDEDIVIIIAHEMINRVLRGLYLNLSTNNILLLRQKNDIILILNNGIEEVIE